MKSTVPDEQLEHFLTSQGVRWQRLSMREHAARAKQFDARYEAAFEKTQKVRMRNGVKATKEYRAQIANIFFVVPFLGDRGGPHGIGKRGPRTCAYECEGDGGLPDLSEFAEIDFFVVPVDMSWAMIHTHEDHLLGGPYFFTRDWITSSLKSPALASAADGSKLCPRCGAAFTCGLAAGAKSCWCSELPNVIRIPCDNEFGCLCPACLQEAIRQSPHGDAEG